MKRLKSILIGIVGLGLIISTPANAALSDATLDFMGINGIYYYNPLGTSSCIIGVGSWDGNKSSGLTALQSEFVDTYHNIAEQLSIEYGIPWEAVMAQGILESGAGTSKFARERNNFFGLGAVDSNPNAAYSYATPMAGWRGYYDFIKNNSRYKNHGVFKEPTITNPYAYIQAIKNAGYATDPNYVTKVSKLIDAILVRASAKGWMTSAQLATAHPEMINNANQNASNGATTGSTNISYTDTSCIIGGGNGDINETALLLAWPDHTHDKSDPKPEYIKAQQQFGMWGSQDENNCSIYLGASCDRFVATVILYSGVDPNFPKGGGVAKLIPYLENSSLFQEVQNTGNTSDLQPGDILAKPASGNVRGHIQIYVRKEDGSYGIASASYCDRTGEISGTYSSMANGYRIFRYTGKTS